MILYIFSMVTALMLSLLVIILVLYRSMKLLERILALVSQMDERAGLEKPGQERTSLRSSLEEEHHGL